MMHIYKHSDTSCRTPSATCIPLLTCLPLIFTMVYLHFWCIYISLLDLTPIDKSAHSKEKKKLLFLRCIEKGYKQESSPRMLVFLIKITFFVLCVLVIISQEKYDICVLGIDLFH